MSLGDEVDRIKAERSAEERSAAADAERAMQRWHDELRELWLEVESYCRDRGIPLPTHQVDTLVPKLNWLGRPKRDADYETRTDHLAGLTFVGEASALVAPGQLMLKVGSLWLRVQPEPEGHEVVYRAPGWSDIILACGPEGPVRGGGLDGRPVREAVIEALARL